MDSSRIVRDPEGEPEGTRAGVLEGLEGLEGLERLLDDAFLDALAGLDRACRYLAIVLCDAGSPDAPDRGHASHAATAGALGASRVPGGAACDAGQDDDPLDALLGLVSLYRTVSLLLAAAGCDPVEQVEPAPAAAWSREVLR